MDEITLEHVESLADQLSVEDLRALTEHLTSKLQTATRSVNHKICMGYGRARFPTISILKQRYTKFGTNVW
jgi:hypothetical protein